MGMLERFSIDLLETSQMFSVRRAGLARRPRPPDL